MAARTDRELVRTALTNLGITLKECIHDEELDPVDREDFAIEYGRVKTMLLRLANGESALRY